ncbi:MAG: Ig-like domain-containing protein [Bacteroidota bacterium]|nr:Ig-like domain-containing protein [Bacteroidota bacterium]
MKIKTILVILSILLSVQSFAQKQLKHNKKIYKTPEGKLYINKALPIYLYLSDSKDENAKKYRLQSKDSKKYTNPMYLDTEGYNTVRSPSKVDTATKKTVYPLEDIIFEVYSDSRAPRTSINFTDIKLFKKNGINYAGEKLEISFKQYDAMSGIDATYYSINGSNYSKFKEKLILDKEAEYILKYYSVDNVGNVEKANEIKFSIDLEAPKTSLAIDKDKHNNIISSRSKIILTAEDKISKVKKIFFQFDDNKTYHYSKAIIISGLKEGKHKLTYYSVDNINNQETEKTFDFYIDKTPPMIIDEILGNTFIANGKKYSSGRSKIKLTCMDNKAGVKNIKYSINNGDYIEYTKPFYINQSGELSIKAIVSDNVNNKRLAKMMTNKSNIAYVDLSGPNMGHRFGKPHFTIKDTTFIQKSTKIYLSSKDKESGVKKIEYTIDETKKETFNKPFTISNEGIHKINYTGYDNVNNSNISSFICFVDNTVPEIFHRFSVLSEKQKNINGKKIDIYPKHAILFLSATDTNVGLNTMHYSINGNNKLEYKSLIDNFDSNKFYKIKISASDKLNNSSTKTIEFFIE